MGYIEIITYDKNNRFTSYEKYVGGGHKKYDANGKIIEYTPKVDDESINDDIDEPDEVFYKLYPWERKKLEEE